MNPRKYVIVKPSGMEIEVAILFDGIMEHRQFCDSGNHPIGAGFYDVMAEDGKLKVVCYGNSETLRCKSRGEEDAAVIMRHFLRER